MDFAKIIRTADRISPSDIDELIAGRDELNPIPDRTGINPFTREPITFKAPPGALYQANGETLGNLTLEDGVILTTGIPESVVVEIAAALKAEWSEDDRS